MKKPTERGAEAMLSHLGGLDGLLDDVPETIEESLEIAVRAGRMTPEEATECMKAYVETFHKTEKLLESPPNQMTFFDP